MRQHLTAAFHCTANLEAWRHLRCYLSWTLRHTWPSIVGDQAFPVAATRTWNSRPTPPPNMSCPYPLCMFSEVASKLSCLGIPSHDFHHKFAVPGQGQLSFSVSDTSIVCFTLVMLRFPNFDFRSISIRFLAQNDDFDSIRF